MLRFSVLTCAVLLSLVSAQQCGQQAGGVTCQALGFPDNCCSEHGWCGVGPTYCGEGCQSGPCDGPGDDPDIGERLVVGYYPAWGIYDRDYHIRDIPIAQVTHVFYAFANLSCEATYPEVVVGDIWGDTQEGGEGNFGRLRDLKRQYPHFTSMISVGGWTWSHCFSDAAVDEQAREIFATSAVNFIITHGFDGVDLDWEYPHPTVGGLDDNIRRPEDPENWILLLRLIRTKLDALGVITGKHHPLTVAVGANPTIIADSHVQELNDVVDFVAIMTYDYYGAWDTMTGHNSPMWNHRENPIPGFYSELAIQKYMEMGLTKEKTVMGVPFYGRGWANVGNPGDNYGLWVNATGDPATEGTWEPNVWDYTDLVDNYIGQQGYVEHHDDESDSDWIYSPQTQTMISYVGPDAMRRRADYINEHDLAGAMFWEFSCDRRKDLFDVLVDQLD